jgi:hypothetical protein
MDRSSRPEGAFERPAFSFWHLETFVATAGVKRRRRWLAALAYCAGGVAVLRMGESIWGPGSTAPFGFTGFVMWIGAVAALGRGVWLMLVGKR